MVALGHSECGNNLAHTTMWWPRDMVGMWKCHTVVPTGVLCHHLEALGQDKHMNNCACT